jgi:hypothetical protein
MTGSYHFLYNSLSQAATNSISELLNTHSYHLKLSS